MSTCCSKSCKRRIRRLFIPNALGAIGRLIARSHWLFIAAHSESWALIGRWALLIQRSSNYWEITKRPQFRTEVSPIDRWETWRTIKITIANIVKFDRPFATRIIERLIITVAHSHTYVCAYFHDCETQYIYTYII